jgi:hypothetical protein
MMEPSSRSLLSHIGHQAHSSSNCQWKGPLETLDLPLIFALGCPTEQLLSNADGQDQGMARRLERATPGVRLVGERSSLARPILDVVVPVPGVFMLMGMFGVH